MLTVKVEYWPESTNVFEIENVGAEFRTELNPNGTYIEFAMELVVAESVITTFTWREFPTTQEGK